MDEVLNESLVGPYVKGDSRQATEDLLWFVVKVFLALMFLEMATAMTHRSIILLTDSLYSAATVTYTAGLLLAYQESHRPPDESYPYGYGNRVAPFQFVSLCLLGAVDVYLLLLYQSYGTTLHGDIGLVAVLASLVTVGISLAVCKKFISVQREIGGPGLEGLEFVLKGAVAISAMALGATLWGAVNGLQGELVFGVMMVVASFCLFAKSLQEMFRVLMDKNIASRSTNSVSLFAQRVARDARIIDVKSRKIGVLTHIEIQAAFPLGYTVAEVNKIERDIECVLRRKLPRIGQVEVYWQT